MIGRRWPVLIVLMLMIAVAGYGKSSGPEARAQSTPPIGAETFPATTRATIHFPKGMTVSGLLDVRQLQADEASSVELLYRIGGNETLHLVSTSTPVSSGADSLRMEASIDLQSSFVPAGIEVDVLWRIHLVDGTFVESDTSPVLWFDNRWQWQTVASSQVAVHYVDLDPEFARTILDSAQSTVTDLERRFALKRSAPLAIWIYSSAGAFQGAQQPNAREAVAAASYPGFQLITAIIPNGDTREVGRVVPHEISHQILYQATRNPFTRPPLWFDEGMATHYHVGGTDGFMEMVIRARERGELFDLDSLDVSFPYASDKATLAYATSWSAIAYIREVRGDGGIAAMIEAFATGAPYPEAIEQALGITEKELNQEWQSWIARQLVSSEKRHMPGRVQPIILAMGVTKPATFNVQRGVPAMMLSLRPAA